MTSQASDRLGEPGLYERVLLASGGALPSLPAAKPPRASAAVVLWRRGPRGDGPLEVYWIRRGRALPFMAGWHAFPGGGLDRNDSALPVEGTPRHPSPERPTSPAPDWPTEGLQPDLVPGLAGAALRELVEEVGVALVAGAPSAAVRATLSTNGGDLAAALAAHGARLDASRLDFAGRWLTPPFGALRFDNRFFLAEWRAGDDEPRVLSDECEAGEWTQPARALAEVDRGSAITAPPIAHILRVLVDEGIERAMPRLLDTSEADLGPTRRIEFRSEILQFPLAAATLPPASHTNVYVVGAGDCVLVDPGSPFEEENVKLLAALERARSALSRRVVEIWLTHHHPDHVAGVERLRRALGVPVAAHAATAERLAPRGIAVDRLLEPGQETVLAGEPAIRMRVHHTPGHARGHLAFEVVREGPGDHRGDLLGGDLVAGLGTIVIDPPDGNMDDYLASLGAMRGRGFRTLFPAHGAPILDVGAKLDEYVAHRLAREEQVLAEWRAGAREPAAMIAAVYPEVPPAIHPLAERQIVAHLERLERMGKLT